jgi:hypothetical protein
VNLKEVDLTDAILKDVKGIQKWNPTYKTKLFRNADKLII